MENRGLFCEKQVENFFLNKGWKVLGRRIRTPFGEIDLLVSKNSKLLVIEVKSISNENFIANRIHHKQKKRLTKTLEYFIEKTSNDVELLIVYVDYKSRFQFFRLF